MGRPTLIAAARIVLCVALLLVPLAWVLPLSERLGTPLCLWLSGPVALSLFAYYLAWGWGLDWLRRRGGRPDLFFDLLIYVNLPITLVYLYRATHWSAPFRCG
jgi:hypothetical protein